MVSSSKGFYEIGRQVSNSKLSSPSWTDFRIGQARLCSANFKQRFAFGAPFCGSRNLTQSSLFKAIFEQNMGLEHIKHAKSQLFQKIFWQLM